MSVAPQQRKFVDFSSFFSLPFFKNLSKAQIMGEKFFLISQAAPAWLHKES